MHTLTAWFKRYFSDPQVVFLAVLLAVGFGIVITMGDMLTPVLASVVIAYLLEGIVGFLERYHVRRILGVLLVYTTFMAFLVFVLFGLLPLLSRQVTQVFQQVPSMIAKGQQALMRLPELYPEYVNEGQVIEVSGWIRNEIGDMGQGVLSLSLSSVLGLITLLVYLVLMPLLVFFFLKDKHQIVGWFARYLPKDRHLASRVWRDVDRQIGNYVRGKFWEILIVWSVTLVVFSLMGLQYAMLLGVLVGLSVVVPYIGAVVATIPVALIAYYQWGWSTDFMYVLLAYAVIQVLDGNVLVPLLFSDVVNLHPVAIIVAVLVFGGLWGFWGVFFAIPLATLVNAVITAWPRGKKVSEDGGQVERQFSVNA
jgi:putative permease